MRYSRLFGHTVREAPKDAVLASHQLLYRAGFIRDLVAGRYLFTPLGFRVMEKIMKIIDEEMKAIGGERVSTPTLHPLELWQATHRDQAFGESLMRVKDRRGAWFAIGATAEAVMTEFVKKFKPSFKDLPIVIYQFSQKFRDELRARGGLIRVREFIMKDSYSFAADEESFMKTYWDHFHAYERIAGKLGIEVVSVEADSGALGGDFCHEFISPTPYGEDTIFTCECGYRANRERATFFKDNFNFDEKTELIAEVEAKRGKTMEDGMKLHEKPLWQQIKDVMYVDENGRFILAIIRGDLDVNEVKLSNLTGSHELRHAEDEEIREKLGSEPGFISPVGIKDSLAAGVELLIVADESLKLIKNAYGGANKKDKDFVNINFGRDYRPDLIGDIAEVQAGFLCSTCKKDKLKEVRGIEFGHVFKYDDFYSKAMGATFVDKDGEEKFLFMGAYGIGIERAMAIIVESHHDEKGIIWPKSVAPFDAHLIGLNSEKAEKVYEELKGQGLEVLYDDREVTAGVKFADADLIGIPVRLVVSEKTGDKIEYKERDQKESEVLPLEKVIKRLAVPEV
jgi:prolyl-tRNA synthetase